MKRMVMIDSLDQIMWIKGRTDISPLTYREIKEGEDMRSGSICKDNIRYFPPFRYEMEEVK